jgi:8-oxo-dGTP pyrophosphatase MutT (NUDIX family)
MPTPDFILSLRKKIGTHPLWLSGVTAVILRGDNLAGGRDDREVLLVRRADNGDWTPVTGIIDPGEEPAVAAEREALEEASVVVVAEHLAWVQVTEPLEYGNGDRAQYLDLVFRCRYVSGAAAVGDEENTDVRWCRLDALRALEGIPANFVERILQAADGTAEARFQR